jgi:hypothetical protein
MVEDHAEMAESNWMPSGMAEAVGILEATERNEAIVKAGAGWVVGAMGLVEASGMLVVMSISYTKIIEI